MNDEDIVIEAGRWLRLHADPGGIIAGTDMRTYDPGGIIAGADMRTYSLIGRLTTEIERLRADVAELRESCVFYRDKYLAAVDIDTRFDQAYRFGWEREEGGHR